MSDIVERLREVAERADANYPAIMEQAADTITTLRAEVERLRVALEPFAHAADIVVPQIDMLCGKGFYGHLQAARAALGEEKSPLADLASRQVDLPPEDKSLLYGNLTKLYTETDNDR